MQGSGRILLLFYLALISLLALLACAAEVRSMSAYPPHVRQSWIDLVMPMPQPWRSTRHSLKPVEPGSARPPL
jgi:hypothetical protein